MPLLINKEQYDLFVVMEEENIQRMKEADPGEIPFPLPAPFDKAHPRNIYLCYENDKDWPELSKLLAGRDPNKIAQFLMRGWKYRPDKGDHDQGPQKLMNQ